MRKVRKLDAVTVLAIMDRCRAGDRQRDVAVRFGTTQTAVSEIVNGRSYRDVTGLSNPQSATRPTRALRRANIIASRRQVVTVRCLTCHAAVQWETGWVIDARGTVHCPRCKEAQ